MSGRSLLSPYACHGVLEHAANLGDPNPETASSETAEALVDIVAIFDSPGAAPPSEADRQNAARSLLVGLRWFTKTGATVGTGAVGGSELLPIVPSLSLSPVWGAVIGAIVGILACFFVAADSSTG